jgi:hypothetical protein
MHAQTDTDAAREFADIVGESQLLIGEAPSDTPRRVGVRGSGIS